MTTSPTASPTSSDGVSEDLSFEENAPDGVHIEDSNLNTVEEINNAIEKYKEMILQTEGCSNDRKWLVRTLIQLRYKLEILKENETEEEQDKEVILAGHHFVLNNSNPCSYLNRCDVCCGYVTLYGLKIYRYECSDCHYITHTKCVSKSRRTCAFVKAAEQPHYNLNICPEVTLLEQKYKCYECKSKIVFKNDWADPRLCDYDGHYYCDSCHWMEEAVIPARVLLNWDFEKQPVCRANFQLLKIMMNRSIIDVNEINFKLFGFIEGLAKVKKYRDNLLLMKQYLITCRIALDKNLLWNTMGNRRHLIEHSSHIYSLTDLIEVKSDVLIKYLESVTDTFEKHIKKECRTCYFRGYHCEICQGNMVIFPFDLGVDVCKTCQSIYHRQCIRQIKDCPKCKRISKRNNAIEEVESKVKHGQIVVEQGVAVDSVDGDFVNQDTTVDVGEEIPEIIFAEMQDR